MTYEPPPGAEQSIDPEEGRPQGTCSACRAQALEPGFIEDSGQSSQGFARWIAGELQRGLLGGASRFGRERWVIEAWRCTVCGHLDLYARART